MSEDDVLLQLCPALAYATVTAITPAKGLREESQSL